MQCLCSSVHNSPKGEATQASGILFSPKNGRNLEDVLVSESDQTQMGPHLYQGPRAVKFMGTERWWGPGTGEGDYRLKDMDQLFFNTFF